MFNYVNEHYYGNTLTKENCMYVGDGAGRKGMWLCSLQSFRRKTKGFFGWRFVDDRESGPPLPGSRGVLQRRQVPSQCWCHEESSCLQSQDILQIFSKYVHDQLDNEDIDEKELEAIQKKAGDVEMIVLVGSPASGKSTLTRTVFKDYVDINEVLRILALSSCRTHTRQKQNA